MTKRLSLWNQELSEQSRGAAQAEPKASPVPPATAKARFYAVNPHLIPPVEQPAPPEPAPGPPAEAESPALEAGSWEGAEVVVPLERSELPDRRRGKKPRRVPRHKTRRYAVSIAVSEEEERILRTYAAGLNKSFSEWSRTVLFKAMGRRVPSRQGKEEV